ncbi:MAG: nitrilase-related carbon-nitrogen hydrolase [Halanaerobiales bacterium]
MDFKVTLIQSNIKIGKEKYNFNEMKKQLYKAVESNTDLVVLPETWVTGFGQNIFDNINSYAKKENNEILQYLKDFALDNDLHIVGGTILEKERDGNIYNNLYYINRKGIVESKYRKMHLYSPGREHKVVTPGHDISVVETEFGKFGFMICYDVRFPELARLYAQEGVDVLYVVANFNDPKKDQWLNQLKARALENQFYVVACNRSGEKYFGNSVIISPKGEVVLNAGRREGIYSGYVDLSLIKAVRKELPYLDDRRDDIYNLTLN